MNAVLVWIGVALLFLGSLVTALSALGLLHFRSVYARMHVSAKPQSFGILLMSIGMACALQTAKGIAVAVLVVALQYLTVPISSHMLGRAAFRAGMEAKTVTDEYSDDIRHIREQADPSAAM